MAEPPYVLMDALFSPDRRYRYLMRRVWGEDVTAPGLFAPALEPFTETEANGGIHEGFKAAGFSPCPPAKMLGVIMLNPSTADARVLDPTNKRVVNFAASWGYAGVVVGNIFAFRSTDPKGLYDVGNPLGLRNLEYLARLWRESGAIMCAWGKHGALRGTGANVKSLLGHLAGKEGEKPVFCLGLNRDGSPKHPLYVNGTAKRLPFPVVAS